MSKMNLKQLLTESPIKVLSQQMETVKANLEDLARQRPELAKFAQENIKRLQLAMKSMSMVSKSVEYAPHKDDGMTHNPFEGD